MTTTETEVVLNAGKPLWRIIGDADYRARCIAAHAAGDDRSTDALIGEYILRARVVCRRVPPKPRRGGSTAYRHAQGRLP